MSLKPPAMLAADSHDNAPVPDEKRSTNARRRSLTARDPIHADVHAATAPPKPTISSRSSHHHNRTVRDYAVLISMQFSIEERVELQMRVQALKGSIVHNWQNASRISHVIVKLDEQLTFSSGGQNVCIRCNEYFVGVVNRAVIVSHKWISENYHRHSFVDTKPYEVIGENGSETCMFSYAPLAVRRGLVSPLENYTFFMSREFIPETNVGYLQYILIQYILERSAVKIIETVSDLENLLNAVRQSPAAATAIVGAGRKRSRKSTETSSSFATPAKISGRNSRNSTAAAANAVDADNVAECSNNNLLHAVAGELATTATPAAAVTTSKRKKSSPLSPALASSTSIPPPPPRLSSHHCDHSTSTARSSAIPVSDSKIFLLAGGCLQNYAVSAKYKDLAQRLNLRIVCACYIWDSISTWTKTGYWNYVLFGEIFGAHVDRKVHHIPPSFIKYNQSLRHMPTFAEYNSKEERTLMNNAEYVKQPTLLPERDQSSSSAKTSIMSISQGLMSSISSNVAGAANDTAKRRTTTSTAPAAVVVNGTKKKSSHHHHYYQQQHLLPPAMPPPSDLPPHESKYFYGNLADDVCKTLDAERKQRNAARTTKRQLQSHDGGGGELQQYSSDRSAGSNSVVSRAFIDGHAAAAAYFFSRFHVPPPLQRQLPKQLYRNEFFVPGYEQTNKWLETSQAWDYVEKAELVGATASSAGSKSSSAASSLAIKAAINSTKEIVKPSNAAAVAAATKKPTAGLITIGGASQMSAADDIEIIENPKTYAAAVVTSSAVQQQQLLPATHTATNNLSTAAGAALQSPSMAAKTCSAAANRRRSAKISKPRASIAAVSKAAVPSSFNAPVKKRLSNKRALGLLKDVDETPATTKSSETISTSPVEAKLDTPPDIIAGDAAVEKPNSGAVTQQSPVSRKRPRIH